MNSLKNYLNIFSLITDKAERFRFILLQCFVFSLPFDRLFSSVILILLSVLTVFDIKLDKLKNVPKVFFAFQFVYFLSIIGYFCSFHKSHAGFVLEKQLAIFLFPLILPLAIKIDEAKIRTSLITLCVSTLVATIYLFASVVWDVVFELQIPFFHTLSSGMFFNHQFSKPLSIHAGYLSLYVALSIIFIIRNFVKELNRSLKLIFILVLIVLFGGLFFLASRNSILAVSFILLFVMPFYRLKKKVAYFLIMSSLLVISFFVLNKVPYLKERFSSELVLDMNSNLGMNTADNFKVLEPRFDRWLATFELIKKSPLIGYGTGDEEEMLKTAFIKNGLYISYLMEFNAHNQYLSILVKHGIIGLLLFLFALIYFFKLAISEKDFIYISFLLLISIGFFTENILDANKGIFFFALFNTLFGYKCLAKMNTKSIKKE